MMKHRLKIIVVIVLIVFSALSIASAIRESLTYDEIVHIQEGKNALLHQTFQIDTNNPPLIRELAVVPLVLGIDKFIPSSVPNIQALPARVVVIGLSVFLGVYVFVVAQQYLGITVAVFALLLYIFEPNILANSHYVTQDIGVTLFFFLAYITLIRTIEKPRRRNFVALGIFTGLMAASKVTALPYFGLSAMLVLLFLLKKQWWKWIIVFKKNIILSCIISMMMVWTTYFYQSSVIVVPMEREGRVSARLEAYAKQTNNKVLLSSLNFLKTKEVPLGDYIAVIKNTVIRSTVPANIFFLGNFYANSRWYFMGVNAFLKTPIPLIILYLAGFWFGLSDKKRNRLIIILEIPVISILIIASFANMQSFVRYILPMYPFVILIAASCLSYCKNSYQKIILIILCLWYVVGTMKMFPHFISYANEFAGGGNTKIFRFMDSNMDWGQSLITLKHYIDRVGPSSVSFSYFGRDDAALYGFPSDTPFGGYKFDDICAFHAIRYPNCSGPQLTVISLSNWYYCGYYQDPKYSKNKLKTIVGDSMLIFPVFNE
jgi:hypothetical protein